MRLLKRHKPIRKPPENAIFRRKIVFAILLRRIWRATESSGFVGAGT